MKPAQDAQIDEAIGRRATEWFVRHRAGTLEAGEQEKYLQWLRSSPQHVRAYLDLIALASKLPEALSGLRIDCEGVGRDAELGTHEAEQALFTPSKSETSPKAHRPRRMSLALAATLLVAVACAVYWSARTWFLPQSIMVGAGQQRVVTLDDGSIVHLNSGTRIVLEYSDTQRLIELRDGQALFNVKHDARRPFIVRAGASDVVALGTQFDVDRRHNATTVTVVEGRIEIISPSSAGDGPSVPQRLGAGEQLRLSASGNASRRMHVDARQVTAWSHKEVTFSAERLEDVAAQFNQFTGAHIDIDDAMLRDYRVSGVFQAYDLDSFLAYLEQFEGVHIERDGLNVQVRRIR